jgi:hypothetical protein
MQANEITLKKGILQRRNQQLQPQQMGNTWAETSACFLTKNLDNFFS